MRKVSLELVEALKQLQREKNINADEILEVLSIALATAYRKNYHIDEETDVSVTVDMESGDIKVFKKEPDEKEEKDVTPENFGRIAAQTAKQVILQKIRDVERNTMYDEYHGREGEIVTGIVQQSDARYTLISLGKVEALLPPNEQVSTEKYRHGTRLKAYITEVRKTTKEPQIVLSRSHPGLLKKLFELEVPELVEGFCEIKSVARESGSRSKIAVHSDDENVDPVGACVGPRGSRVRMVVGELWGEKIDVVHYDEDMEKFIANALSPAKVKEVEINEEKQSAEVTVPDDQLSLAIGKEGQNARLAAKLTGWRIDIKSEAQLKEGDETGEEAEEKEEKQTGKKKEETVEEAEEKEETKEKAETKDKKTKKEVMAEEESKEDAEDGKKEEKKEKKEKAKPKKSKKKAEKKAKEEDKEEKEEEITEKDEEKDDKENNEEEKKVEEPKEETEQKTEKPDEKKEEAKNVEDKKDEEKTDETIEKKEETVKSPEEAKKSEDKEETEEEEKDK